MTPKEQLAKWVLGESVHDHEYGKSNDSIGGQCCPDFSCCQPDLKWPKEKRELYAERFLAGDHETINALNTEALASGMKRLNVSDKKVQVIDERTTIRDGMHLDSAEYVVHFTQEGRAEQLFAMFKEERLDIIVRGLRKNILITKGRGEAFPVQWKVKNWKIFKELG